MYIVAWLERGEFGLRSAVRAIKHRKTVHGARLGDRLAKQPQQLLIPERRRRALRREPRRVVQPELEPARPAGPRVDLIAHREQRDPALPTRGIAAAVAAAIAGAADVGPRGGEEDVERCVAETQRCPVRAACRLVSARCRGRSRARVGSSVLRAPRGA